MNPYESRIRRQVGRYIDSILTSENPAEASYEREDQLSRDSAPVRSVDFRRSGIKRYKTALHITGGLPENSLEESREQTIATKNDIEDRMKEQDLRYIHLVYTSGHKGLSREWRAYGQKRSDEIAKLVPQYLKSPAHRA